MDIRDKIADGFAAVDELAEDAQSTFHNRWVHLVNNVDERIPFIWADAKADMAATPKSIGAVPPNLREYEWSKSVELVYAAAFMQAYFEYLSIPIYQKSMKHSAREKESAKHMSRDELIRAAMEGTGRDRFESAKARRKSRSTVS
jgi:hypothetical protein